MSHEGYSAPKVSAEAGLYDKLETLLAKLPEELADEWRDRFEDAPKEKQLPVEKQIAKIESIIAARKQEKPTLEAKLLPEGVEIYTTFPDDLREIIEATRDGDRTTEVGYGQAGHVIADKELHPNICYKMLFDDEVLPDATNDIARETELLHSISGELDGFAGVRVPKVYGFIKEPGTRAITMELLDAASLRRIVERGTESFPETFDSKKFFTALKSFIEEMNKRGYYHRDLHGGNVLVDRTTGMPCVIDFGLSKFAPIDDGEMYREIVYKDGHSKEILLQSDTDNLNKLETDVRNYQLQRKDGVSL